MGKRILGDKKKNFNEVKKVIPTAQPSMDNRAREKEEQKEKEEEKDSILNGEELFSKFTADIIKEDVFFTR